jgi:AraC-like DNA-binding protein
MNVAESFGIESLMLLEDDEIGVQSEENAVPAHRHEALFEKIKSLLTEKKIFQDPDLSLGKVTELVGSNRRYVSEAINMSTGMKFNDYVNFHRINEAKKLIKEESSLSDVQYACGFNSRTSFYSAFKKFTHMTPSEFSKKQRNR